MLFGANQLKFAWNKLILHLKEQPCFRGRGILLGLSVRQKDFCIGNAPMFFLRGGGGGGQHRISVR